MTARQTALFEYHRSLAEFSATAEAPVFWVLDLEDREGFGIAEAMGSANLADRRDACIANGEIPALTAITPIPLAKALLAHGWRIETPLDSDQRYIAIMSDGRCVVGCLKRPHS